MDRSAFSAVPSVEEFIARHQARALAALVGGRLEGVLPEHALDPARGFWTNDASCWPVIEFKGGRIMTTPAGPTLWLRGRDRRHRDKFKRFLAEHGLAHALPSTVHVDHVISKRAHGRASAPALDYRRSDDFFLLFACHDATNRAWGREWERFERRGATNTLDFWPIAKCLGISPPPRVENGVWALVAYSEKAAARIAPLLNLGDPVSVGDALQIGFPLPVRERTALAAIGEQTTPPSLRIERWVQWRLMCDVFTTFGLPAGVTPVP